MTWWNPFTWGQRIAIKSVALDPRDIQAIRIVQAHITGQQDALQTQLDTLSRLESSGRKDQAEQFAVVLRGQIQGFENSPGMFEALMAHDQKTLNGTVLQRLLTVEKRKKR